MRLAVLLALALLWAGDMAAPGQASGSGSASNPEAEAELGLVRGTVTDITTIDKSIQIRLGSSLARQRYGAVISAEYFAAFPDVAQLRGKLVDASGPVVEAAGESLIRLQGSKQLVVVNRPPPPVRAQAVIRGLVAEVLRSDKVIRINLGGKQPNHRSAALIYPDYFPEFPELDKWVGKAVEITGEAMSFPDVPHVQLVSRQQMVLVPAKPTAPATPSGPVPTTGERGTIRGLVAEVLRSDKVIRVNLGAKAPHERFAAVIYPEHFPAFAEVDRLEGQQVEITGEVAIIGGKRQIVLEDMKQVAHLNVSAQLKK